MVPTSIEEEESRETKASSARQSKQAQATVGSKEQTKKTTTTTATTNSKQQSGRENQPGGHAHAAGAEAARRSSGELGAPKYISSLLGKSSVFLNSLKQQYSSLGGAMQKQAAAAAAAAVHKDSANSTANERQLSADSSSSRCSASTGSASCAAPEGAGSGPSSRQPTAAAAPTRPARPALPPPPPREVVQAAVSALSALGGQQQQQQHQQQQQRSGQSQLSPVGNAGGISLTRSLGSASVASSSSPVASARRHALQEQSLERDAALSLKVRELKHKRTSSIKSALRHAHLGRSSGNALKISSSSSSSHANSVGEKGASSLGSSGDQLVANSMPYELFEPPVTQRTLQRTKRRGAMLSDPRRQMSADTIGLRQLTDEYLHNAGVKPMSCSNQCSLVALSAQPAGSAHPVGASSGSVSLASSASHASAGATASALLVGQQPQFAIESKLYQASKHVTGRFSNSNNNNNNLENNSGSDESLSTVTILPGNLPWQSDVSIQCELLQTPDRKRSHTERYETTGDILNTIAGPFKGGLATGTAASGSLANSTGCSFDSANQLSATLKRGLSAISQHHLSPSSAPSAALNVVGSLKKSLSNTLDISRHSGCVNQLHSQDSLPAYASLQNEPDEEELCETSERELEGAQGKEQTELEAAQQLAQQEAPTTTTSATCADLQSPGSSGLIGQLTSKLSRSSSKKFSVSKKGLQRALSFDCRGYKRLEAQAQAQVNLDHQQQQNNLRSKGLLSASKQRAHNKSTLALSVDLSPRPYLPQSASQVDFQVPLLPYHKMQEAIVSQRRLEPSTASSSVATEGAAAMNETGVVGQLATTTQQLDADELLCAQTSLVLANDQLVEPQRLNEAGGVETKAVEWKATRAAHSRQTPPMRLVLDVPTATLNSTQNDDDAAIAAPATRRAGAATANDDDDDGDDDEQEEEPGEEANANAAADQDASAGSKSNVILCLPSPCAPLEAPFGDLSSSPSFCIEPKSVGGAQGDFGAAGFGPSSSLTAKDVFSRSKIKRPSTMLVSEDAMSQVAQALTNSTSKQQVSARGRRQAIVPPKLATDAEASGVECAEGQLVDVSDQQDDDDHDHEDQHQQQRQDDAHLQKKAAHLDESEAQRLAAVEEAAMRALKRKRSGGGGVMDKLQQQQRQQQHPSNNIQATDRKQAPPGLQHARLSGSQTNLPTFYIEASSDQPASASTNQELSVSARRSPIEGASSGGQQNAEQRPDSQMTNVDSLVSSGSSTNLSLSGKRGEFTVTSPGGLTVSFGSTRGRRRSSIAVIPQMQICPGDLLVYSKQLIDRMNQSDENEPPQFLTIDNDKKGKNIWSSFKLFDNRTMKAKNELLCSLEDVLASLQPSTFVDEQLSHYKGMLWNEFLYETESRRSASSDGLALLNAKLCAASSQQELETNQECEADELLQLSLPLEPFANCEPSAGCQQQHQQQQQFRAQSATSEQERGGATCAQPSASALNQTGSANSAQSQHQTLKATMSGGPPSASATPTKAPFGGSRSAREQAPRISSRFREKPKLKRGQTVDSVFRIPLIPSSPLKHAQQHQQTPTAHLEDHELNTIEDDERSSPSAASRPASVVRRNRSASTRSRSGSAQRAIAASSGNQLQAQKLHSAADAQRLDASTAQATPNNKDQDSSFEADDALDLLQQQAPQNQQVSGQQQQQQQQQQRAAGCTRTPHQIVRQSSLSTLSSTITRTEQKRQRALWDLFQSECAFFFDHLMTLKNVYMEPLKKIQVDGFAMFADPDVLFGNLDELCCGVYDFCKEFLYIIMRTLKTRPEELNATDVLIKLYKKNPKIDHLRGVYHRYTLNYINALTYLESLRRQIEFVEFEKWSSRDIRCKKLQLTDLLVAPVQHIMRVPIILKDIESHTENPRDREEIRAILAVEEASLRELDDKMRWLKNFERLLEIQKNISWPNVLELDTKLFIPEFLKDVLSKQPCEKLIVSPRRQIVHEGTLTSFDLGRACDMHVILFDDMLLLTRRKKGLTKKASTVCKTNSGGSSTKDDGSFKYIVYKQPLSLDRFYVHDVQQVDSQSIGMKHLFLLIVMNRFQQITNVHTFSAPNDDIKQTWLFKIKKTAERWKKNLSSNSQDQQQQVAATMI